MSSVPESAVPNLLNPQDIRIQRLFVTPLALVEHPAAEALNEALKAEIAQRQAEDNLGVRHSNVGGWQSAADFNEWPGMGARALTAFARALAYELTAVQHPEQGLVLPEFDWKINAWANVNRAGNANALHAHPGAFWSGVYWVDDGHSGEEETATGGELEFHDPRGVLPSMYNPELRMRIADCLSAGLTTAITPKSGTLVMFPSWLQHAVTRVTATRPRISIAFNFSV
ncbi:TIGR02466 family protein [Chimaeribacter arupi]|uniref:TIGR02466 family protein n=1 Tax=Chimaeribacter arupi TaxID=2060066 RepID=UPI000C7AE636|nr:TIGR02466 family protein [Chimaeribacter arupi]PLR30562.1 hypothetical protein CYR23_17535 [Chimaeribacter arupi]